MVIRFVSPTSNEKISPVELSGLSTQCARFPIYSSSQRRSIFHSVSSAANRHDAILRHKSDGKKSHPSKEYAKQCFTRVKYSSKFQLVSDLIFGWLLDFPIYLILWFFHLFYFYLFIYLFIYLSIYLILLFITGARPIS